VDTVKIGSKEVSLNILDYDFVFVGSGVYGQLPGKGLMELHRELLQNYVKAGDIRGRPNQADLEEVVEKVKGVLLC